jgi:hypothetical protein
VVKDVVWAKGTGYGYGQRSSTAVWDAKASKAAQEAQDAELEECLSILGSSLAWQLEGASGGGGGSSAAADAPSTSGSGAAAEGARHRMPLQQLLATVRDSVLLPYLSMQLATASFSDMGSRVKYFGALLQVGGRGGRAAAGLATPPAAGPCGVACGASPRSPARPPSSPPCALPTPQVLQQLARKETREVLTLTARGRANLAASLFKLLPSARRYHTAMASIGPAAAVAGPAAGAPPSSSSSSRTPPPSSSEEQALAEAHETLVLADAVISMCSSMEGMGITAASASASGLAAAAAPTGRVTRSQQAAAQLQRPAQLTYIEALSPHKVRRRAGACLCRRAQSQPASSAGAGLPPPPAPGARASHPLPSPAAAARRWTSWRAWTRTGTSRRRPRRACSRARACCASPRRSPAWRRTCPSTRAPRCAAAAGCCCRCCRCWLR